MRHVTAATLLLAFAMVGCGGGGGGIAPPVETAVVVPGPTSEGGTSAPATPPASAPVSPVTLTVPAAARLAGFTRLAWADEFSANGLPDTSKWAYDTERNFLGWYNNELQYYASNRLENAQVLDGHLDVWHRRRVA